MSSVSILGIPYDAMSSYLRGPALGPAAMREALHSGSANYYAEDGTDLSQAPGWQDAGDLELPDNDPQIAFALIEKRIDQLLAAGHQVLSLGGDHSIALPIIRAYARHYPTLHILQIDAHGDLYDQFEGNRYSHACPFARIMEEKLVASLTQVGIRTLTAHQREQADRFGVNIIEMKDFSLHSFPILSGPLYITLDLDGLDPACAPGVSHHEPGGFTTRQVLELLQRIEAPVVGADIVELNPRRDVNGMTAMVGAKLMRELGAMLLKRQGSWF